MGRYRADNKEAAFQEARRRFLEASIHEISERGFEGANINRISMAAGFAKGTIYNYFPDKRGLLVELLRDIGSAHAETLASRTRSAVGPESKLKEFFSSGFDYVAANSTKMKLLMAALSGVDVELQAELGRSYAPLFSLLRLEILGPGMASGAFDERDIQETATILMTLYLGSASQVDGEGKPYLNPSAVADFALAALRPAAAKGA
jgi:AcrR family transcriptional regulator